MLVRLFNLVRAIIEHGPRVLWQDLKLALLRNRLRRKGHHRILSARDLAFPFAVATIVYDNPLLRLNHREEGGFYSFQNLILHTPTGQLIHNPVRNTAAVIIRESTVEDIDKRLAESREYLDISEYDFDGICSVEFDKPAFVFEILARKNNYYHFVIDNLLRLLFLLESIDFPILVLHDPGFPEFAKQYLDILARVYDLSVASYPLETHVRVSSEIIVMDPPLKRYYHEFESAIRENKKALIESDNRLLSRDKRERLKPIYGRDPMPIKWELVDNGRVERYLNDPIQLLPSRSGGEVAIAFRKRLIEEFHIEDRPCKIVFIDRRGETSRGRNISNIDEVIDRFNDIEAVKFGSISVKEQIQIALQTKIMIGVNGSGQVNSMFMKPGGALLNLVPCQFMIPSSNMAPAHCGIHGLHYAELIVDKVDGNIDQLEIDIENFARVIEDLKKRTTQVGSQ